MRHMSPKGNTATLGAARCAGRGGLSGSCLRPAVRPPRSFYLDAKRRISAFMRSGNIKLFTQTR